MLLVAPLFANLVSFESQFPGWFNDLRNSQKVKYKSLIWTKDGVVKYLSDLEKWYQDNVGFKNELVKLNSLGYRLLNTSQDRNKYIIGKKDFLFKGNLSNNVVSVSTGEFLYTTEELEDYYSYLGQVVRYFKNKNIPLYIAISPNKHTIYSEHLPEYLEMKQPTLYDQIIAYQRNPYNIIDLRAPMLNAKPAYGDLLFYKADSHWSRMGAYIAYLEIMKIISMDFPQIEILKLNDYDVAEEVQGGDLAYHANMMNWVRDFSVNMIFNHPLDSLQVNNIKGVFIKTGPDELVELSQKAIVKNDNKPLILLYLRDSFGKNLGYFLHHTFGTVVHVYILSGEAEKIDEYIEKYDPDIVLFEFVERYLNKKPLAPELWYAKELIDNSETLLELKGKEIINHSSRQVNFQSIREEKKMIVFENKSRPGPQLHFNEKFCSDSGTLCIMVRIFAPQRTIAKLFYSTLGQKKFNQANSITRKLSNGWNNVLFTLKNNELTGRFRLDPGYHKGIYKLESLEIKCLPE